MRRSWQTKTRHGSGAAMLLEKPEGALAGNRRLTSPKLAQFLGLPLDVLNVNPHAADRNSAWWPVNRGRMLSRRRAAAVEALRKSAAAAVATPQKRAKLGAGHAGAMGNRCCRQKPRAKRRRKQTCNPLLACEAVRGNSCHAHAIGGCVLQDVLLRPAAKRRVGSRQD